MSNQAINDFKDCKRALKQKLNQLEELMGNIDDDDKGEYSLYWML